MKLKQTRDLLDVDIEKINDDFKILLVSHFDSKSEDMQKLIPELYTLWCIITGD